MSGPDALADELDRLRRDYRRRLPDKWRAIEEEAARLEARPERAEDLLHLVHRLSGSGSSYGFTAVSEAARAAEEVVREMVAAGVTPASRERLSERLAALRSACLEAAGEPAGEADGGGAGR